MSRTSWTEGTSPIGPQAEWLRHSFCPPHGAYSSPSTPVRVVRAYSIVVGVDSDRSQRFATEEVDLELLEYVVLGRVV